LEVQLYELRKRVNTAYFTVLLMRTSKQVLEHKDRILKERLKEVASAVASGTALAANEKLLQAELLLIEQQLQELEAGEKAALDILSVLMGKSLTPGIPLQTPSVDLQLEQAQNRPEYLWYQRKREVLNAQVDLLQKDRMPLFSGFGQVGYGNPGLKFLQDKFDSYYMVGARLRWNVFDWKKNRRKRRLLDLQKELIDTREESFNTNLDAELKSQMRKVDQYKVLLAKDDAILALRQEVTKSAASQLENGVITSADYLEELDREVQARLNQQVHGILLEQAKVEYNRIAGKI
jgi:outer membrane protein TolC